MCKYTAVNEPWYKRVKAWMVENRTVVLVPSIALILVVVALLVACDVPQEQATAAGPTTAHQVDVAVKTNPNGMTTEQENIKGRLQQDNEPGATKHLYVISSMSGQCIMYSTVKGKVTSSGKRLRPTTVSAIDGQDVGDGHQGYYFDYAGKTYATSELPQDDGTFGQSGEYLYWWDTSGKYHQLYLTGGFLVTLSDQPLPIKSITLNLEQHAASE